MATSKTWNQPWTWTLKNLEPKKPGLGKTWTQKILDPEKLESENLDTENLDSEKPGPWKIWTLKNLDYEKRGKQLDAEKSVENHMV